MTERPDNPYLIEREADGAYLIRQRDTSRLIARTADPGQYRGGGGCDTSRAP